ncbi:MAG: hypothetical protein V4635_02285 [Bacteroidota bacterium]
MNKVNSAGPELGPAVTNENGQTDNQPEFTERVIQENNIKVSLVPSKRKKTKKINVIIEGEFNISNAEIVKENCGKLLHHFDFVSITLKNIVDIDLAAVQLLHVLKSVPAFSQKTITIDSELSKEDRILLGGSGLLDVISRKS